MLRFGHSMSPILPVQICTMAILISGVPNARGRLPHPLWLVQPPVVTVHPRVRPSMRTDGTRTFRACVVSHDSDSVAVAALRLSVRPGTMASGTRTGQAGLQALDALDSANDRRAFVYVPPQCVGTTRMPLIVFLHGAGMDGESMINWRNVRRLADSAGVILLAPSSQEITWKLQNYDGRRIDQALRYVLQHYAIDPARIALAGASDGARWALWIGLANGDLFSRVLAFSPSPGNADIPSVRLLPQLQRHGMPPLFIQHGDTSRDFDARPIVQWLQERGYAVTYATDSGPHSMTEERATAGFHWLATSWTGRVQRAGGPTPLLSGRLGSAAGGGGQPNEPSRIHH